VLGSKFSQDSLKTPELKLVMILASLAAKFLFARSESCYENSLCETRKKQFLLRKFVGRLPFRDSSYEISVFETRERQVLLLILTRESRENLVRILGLKSESCFSREFQKGILVSTLVGIGVTPKTTFALDSYTFLFYTAASMC
jgi:hypothetical protein